MAARRVTNWLLGYQEYTKGVEVPPLFHLWVGISCLSAAAQRKIYLDMDFFQVHSNLFVVLTSPPGRSKKGTAMKLGRGLLKDTHKYGGKLHFSTQAGSAAGLIQQFVKLASEPEQSLTTFSLELGSLLGTKNDDATMFLTDIYDCNPDWDKQTISRGLEMIEKPWLNLLGGTTPVWLGDNLSKTALEGGFISRTIFVYEDARTRVAIPKMTEAQKKLRQDLTADLATISLLQGVARLSPDAGKAYTEWYENPERDTLESDPKLATYYERKGIHVLKVALAFSLSESDSLVIEAPHIRAAVGVLTELEPGMRKAFASVGKNPFSTDMDRIEDQVRGAGRITYKQLLGMNVHALEKYQFDDNLTTLIEIQRVYTEGGIIYSPAEWIVKRNEAKALAPSG